MVIEIQGDSSMFFNGIRDCRPLLIVASYVFIFQKFPLWIHVCPKKYEYFEPLNPNTWRPYNPMNVYSWTEKKKSAILLSH